MTDIVDELHACFQYTESALIETTTKAAGIIETLRQRVKMLETSLITARNTINEYAGYIDEQRNELATLKQGQGKYCPVGGNCSNATDCDGSCAPYIGREQAQNEPVGEVFGNRIKWSTGVIPADGTKLYLTTPTQGEPVGVTAAMPGTPGFTMAVFFASDIPVGTSLYTSAPSTPDGWQLVPVEPTWEMLKAAWHLDGNDDDHREVFAAMLSTAPKYTKAAE